MRGAQLSKVFTIDSARTPCESTRIHERLLDRLETLVLREPFDRGDFASIREDRQRDAGADHLPVQKDGERAADADAAPLLGAGEPQIVPEAVEQRAVGGNLHVVRRAVDDEVDQASYERRSFSLSAK